MASKAKKSSQKREKSAARGKTARPARKSAAPKAPRETQKRATNRSSKSAQTARNNGVAKSITSPTPEPKPVVLSSENSGLSKKEIAEFRDILLQKRAQLLGDVNTMRNEALSKNRQDAAGDLSNMPLHMADIGSDNYEQEFTLGLIESERQILHEIEAALERIREKKFGVCAATGEPIGKARLRATPWAKYSYQYVLAQERARGSRF